MTHLTQLQRSMMHVIDKQKRTRDIDTILYNFSIEQLDLVRRFVASFKHEEDALGYVIVDDNKSDEDGYSMQLYPMLSGAIGDAQKDAFTNACNQTVCALIPIVVAKVHLAVTIENTEPSHG